MITVSQLLELLEGEDPEAEVRVMSQPNWPFEYSVRGTWTTSPEPDACGECGLTQTAHVGLDEDTAHAFEPYYEGFAPHADPAGGVVYIVEGRQLGYGTKDAWSEASGPY